MLHAKSAGLRVHLLWCIAALHSALLKTCTIPLHRFSQLSRVHSGFTALHYAARYGHSDIAERICMLHKVLAEEDHLTWVNALDMYAACALSFSHTVDLSLL